MFQCTILIFAHGILIFFCDLRFRRKRPLHLPLLQRRPLLPRMPLPQTGLHKNPELQHIRLHLGLLLRQHLL